MSFEQPSQPSNEEVKAIESEPTENSEGKEWKEKIVKMSDGTKELWLGVDRDEVGRLMDEFSDLDWELLAYTREGKSLYATITHNFGNGILFPGASRNYGAEHASQHNQPYEAPYGNLMSDRRFLATHLIASTDGLTKALLPTDTASPEEDLTESLHPTEEEKEALKEQIANKLFSLRQSAIYYGVDTERENAQIVSGMAKTAQRLEEVGLPVNETYVRVLDLLMTASTAALGRPAFDRESYQSLLEERVAFITNTLQASYDHFSQSGDTAKAASYADMIKKTNIARQMIEASFRASDFNAQHEIIELMDINKISLNPIEGLDSVEEK